MVPKLFEGLVARDRQQLVEITEDTESALTSAVCSLAGEDQVASRAASWNGCDLRTSSGIKLTLARLRYEKPRHVWIALPCEVFSPCQNLTRRNEAQKEDLARRRREAHRQCIGACCVFHTCVQLGIHVSWVWPVQCQAWRLPVMQRLSQRYHLHEGVARACSLGLRHPKTQKFLSQAWKVQTTCSRIARIMDLPCRCPRGYNHGTVEAYKSERHEVYPQALADRVAKVIVQELSHPEVIQECEGRSVLPEQFGIGEYCMCQEVKHPVFDLPCGCCQGEHVVQQPKTDGGMEEEPDDVYDDEGDDHEEFSLWAQQCPMIEEEAKRLLERKDWSFAACENLILQIPLKPVKKHRRMLGTQPATYLLLGLYSHGNHYGVTKRSQQLPQTCNYLNQCMRHWKQGEVDSSSLVISVNNQLPLHRDQHNLPNTLNHVVGLGSYEGGGIWIESQLPVTESVQSRKVLENGKELYGRVWPTRHRVVSFQGTSWHETEAWQGTRVTLAVYCSRGCKVIGPELKEELCSLGFRLPVCAPAVGEADSVESAHVVRQPQFQKKKAERGKCILSEQEKEREKIRRQLYLLHAATGHGSKRVLLDALKRRNASPQVLQLAQEFRCSVCEERHQIGSRHLASLEVLPPKWHAISADIGHWKHEKTGEHVQFMLIIDQGSRFRLARILTRGSKQQPSGPTCLHYLEEGWSQVFGQPRSLRLDPAGAFRGQAITEYCDRHGIHLDLIPADAHWSTGICEQAVKGTKELMSKIVAADETVSPDEALSQAIRTFNEREQIRGYSPIQHAFGRSPDATGRLGAGPQELPDELLVESAGADFERALQRRVAAEKALADWQASQRLSRARNSRSRPLPDFMPGELVYFWRTQDGSQGHRSPGSKRGRFLGPARILAMESRVDDTGAQRTAGAIWVVRGRNLLKCSAEQLRRASPREELLEGLAGQHGEEHTPWTYSRLASEIGGSQFEDISQEVPEDEEWRRAQDLECEVAPPRFRHRGKRAEQHSEEPQLEPTDAGTSSGSRHGHDADRPVARRQLQHGGPTSQRTIGPRRATTGPKSPPQ